MVAEPDANRAPKANVNKIVPDFLIVRSLLLLEVDAGEFHQKLPRNMYGGIP